MLALPRLRPIVLAVAPVYVPEKVRVASVAVRFARETSPATTVAQVADPRAESERTNWLVQDVPAYSANKPEPSVRVIAEVKLETVKLFDTARLVEVAFVVVAFIPVKFCRVEEARERKPPVRVERPETERLERVPTEVRELARTLEARVAPVKVPAGAVPVMLPVRLPVKFPVPEVKKRFVELAVVAKKLVVVA